MPTPINYQDFETDFVFIPQPETSGKLISREQRKGKTLAPPDFMASG